MFKDSFKAANDNIHADEELVNKVLALKNPEKQIQLRRKKRFVSYIPAAAAAVIIVCGTAASIPYLTKPHSDDGVIYTASSETTSPNTDNAAASAVPQNGGEQSANAADIPAVSSQQSAAADNTEKSLKIKSSSNAADNSAAALSATEPVKSAAQNRNSQLENSNPDTSAKAESSEFTYNLSGSDVSDNPPAVSIDLPYVSAKDADSGDEEVQSEAADAYAPILKKTEERVVLSLNEGAYASARSGSISETAALALYADYVSWSYRDYFDYIGKYLNPVLPEDFVLIGHEAKSITDTAVLNETFYLTVDENGSPVFDNQIFGFEGNNNRYISIQTTKDISSAMTYLTDSSLSHSKIGDTYGVIIGTFDDCRCYMICNKTAYIINVRGLSENELKDLLLSIEE